MGLASALSTALTGLQAAETIIDVAGNNLANSNTIAFKASEAVFATQFLQTQSLGSAPTATSGGTNPRQIGLGTKVAEITPDFTQGTIEVSSSPSDLAIQGDGFFAVQSISGETLYTRNGIFKTNSSNELVTINGQRVLGHGINSDFQIQSTQLVPITIPLGSTQVAQETQNVFLEGQLIPEGDIADQAAVIDSAVLGDGLKPRPATGTTVAVAPLPDTTAGPTTAASASTGGSLTPGDVYRYKFVFVDTAGKETLPSADSVPPAASPVITVAGGDDSITLSNIPNDAAYSLVNIYRTKNGGSSYFQVAQVAAGAGSYTDTTADASLVTALNEDKLTGGYKYYVTFFKVGQPESRPSPIITPPIISGSRIHLTNFPTPPVVPPGGGFPAYDQIRIYRSLADNFSDFFLVDTVNVGQDYTDSVQDSVIASNAKLDLDGPKIGSNTLLTDIVRSNAVSDNVTYSTVFQLGTLKFNAVKGGRTLFTTGDRKEFTISATSTVQQLIDFMRDSMGIQLASADLTNPIPGSINTLGSGTLSAGASIINGQLRFVSNNGVDNAVDIKNSGIEAFDSNGALLGNVSLSFSTVQTAVGESAVTDFVVFDTLGIPIDVRVTAVLESSNDANVIYRWFAESADNAPLVGTSIAVGTGLITFDGEGNFVSATEDTVSIERRNIPSISPLDFDLNFDGISGLNAASSSLAASRQDGSGPGTLSSFIIGEDGTIRGVFSNGVTRDLGRIRLTRFANPTGLEQRGENLFSPGVNSGLPIDGNPGSQGIGSIVAGAVELSNTDIGQSLIDLILASTQYRSNTRVVNTAQQLLDELLNLRR